MIEIKKERADKIMDAWKNQDNVVFGRMPIDDIWEFVIIDGHSISVMDKEYGTEFKVQDVRMRDDVLIFEFGDDMTWMERKVIQ